MARSPISPATSAFRNKRLSVIAEDGSTVPASRGRNPRAKPPSPAQTPPYSPASTANTSHRPESRQWMDKPPHHSADASPPGYEHWNEAAPRSRMQRLMDKVRSNKQIARRGGWKRLLIILLVLLLLILALAIGLGVGLSQRNNSVSSSSSSPSSSTSGGGNGGDNTTSVPPEGSYAITLYSTQSSAACTANSSTWNCLVPLYTPSDPGSSLGIYDFMISAADDSNNPPRSFNISATNNPFSDTFSNIALTLENNGTSEEHYAFNITQVKQVTASPSFVSNGLKTYCFYNNTVLRGALYTKKPMTNISTTTTSQQSTNAGSNPTTNENWKPWPYAVSITETASGGDNVPNCYVQQQGGALGPRIAESLLPPQSTGTTCECAYQNFDLPA